MEIVFDSSAHTFEYAALVALPGAVMVSSTAESGLRTRIDFPSEEEDMKRGCWEVRGWREKGMKAGWVKAWERGSMADRARHMAPVSLAPRNMLDGGIV